MVPAMTVEGGTDTAVFATYLQHFLLPALSPGTVVVVDNVGAHKPERIRALFAAAGCRLLFLPAYSPDLSPVEEAFSKIKTLVKAAAARTRAALDAAIAVALAAVTAEDAAGWFVHAGYLTPEPPENRCQKWDRLTVGPPGRDAGVRRRHARLPWKRRSGTACRPSVSRPASSGRAPARHRRTSDGRRCAGSGAGGRRRLRPAPRGCAV